MNSTLPIMLVDEKRYNQILSRGFARFPERRKNWEKLHDPERSHSVIVDHYPGKMYIEPVGRCNFRCIACDLSALDDGVRGEDMTLDQLMDLVDQLPGLYEVILNGVGEGTLHRDLFKMITSFAERDIWVLISTNGSLLHQKDNYRRFIDAGVGEVVCSFDGATKEVFEAIRPGAVFEKLCRNFKLLNDYCKSKDLLRTRSYTVVQNLNVDTLKDIIDVVTRLGFPRHTFGLGIFNWSNDVLDDRLGGLRQDADVSDEMGWDLIEYGSQLGVEITFMFNEDRFKRGEICPYPFERAFVGQDLKIAPCCRVNPKAVDLGYAHNFAEAWNSAKYQEFRRQHLRGEIPKVCQFCYEN